MIAWADFDCALLFGRCAPYFSHRCPFCWQFHWKFDHPNPSERLNPSTFGWGRGSKSVFEKAEFRVKIPMFTG
jgi:hypothetical protein